MSKYLEKVKRGGGVHPVDDHVGRRIRTKRQMMGMSQEKLADRLGVTFQQVQKYENGSNRVGASRLFHLSHELKMPVSAFFEGLDQPENAPEDVTREEAVLLNKLRQLPKHRRRAVVAMISEMAEAEHYDARD